MDGRVGEEFLTKARHSVMENDHSEADALFDEVLSSTIFSLQTNRRIFRGMIRFSDHDRWRQVFDRVLQNSRFDLPSAAVDTYRALSFEYVVNYLVSRGESRPATLDPTAELNLRFAKKSNGSQWHEAEPRTQDTLPTAPTSSFPFRQPP